MTDTLTIAFANIGRKLKGSTVGIDHHALAIVRDHVPDTRTIVQLCEVNEGDDDNELAIARAMFHGWTCYAGAAKANPVREPIFVSPDLPRARAHVRWLPGTAVKHWSPERSLQTLYFPDLNLTVMGIHHDAGAHGQGTRPAWAVPLLNHGWDTCRTAHETTARRHHDLGRDVAWMADVNDYGYPPLGHGEETVVHQQTDWGRVWPASGRALWKALPAVPLPIDSHDLQRMRGHFARP